VNVPGRGAVLNGVSFDLEAGSKIGVVGPNGAGKSTLIKTMMGDIPVASGDVKVGDGIYFGYLSQDPPEWPDATKKVLEVATEMATTAIVEDDDSLLPGISELTPERRTTALLRSINFAPSRWNTQVGMLSGGENRRLQLLRVLVQRPNILVLDEPTNDLDAVTVDSLEELLQPFPGTVILVSHDRSLLDGVCKKFLVLQKDGSQPMLWTGTHEQLMKEQKKNRLAEEAKAAAAASAAKAASAPAKRGKSKDEQRELAIELRRVEREVERLENKIASLDEEMTQAWDKPDEMEKLVADREATEERQKKVYERWEQLMAEAD